MQTREIDIGLLGIDLHGMNGFGSYVIDADGRFGIVATRLRITQRVRRRVLRILVIPEIVLPTEGRHFMFVEAHKSQLFGVRRPGKECRRAKFLFVQPIGDTIDDIRVAVFGHRHFGAEIEFMDIEVIVLGKGDIPPVRTHHRIPHLPEVLA